ncbi:cmkA [Symbiodinium pilosum]|uniref:CmkA protein n=1 Tax=Symbiodinium pilosum TaxID=2952 RepID=A0A812LD15_SYMPI|nr:cmkA [Symbiodinium pilosum]
MLGEQSHSFNLDLFGVGLILFRLLAGYAPFEPPSRFTQPEFDERYWCHVSGPCRELVAQLLSLQPAKRGTAAECLQHAWLAGLQPPEPSPEKLQELSTYGALPDTTVLFWPVNQIPSKEWQKSYANLADAAGEDEELSPTSA